MHNISQFFMCVRQELHVRVCGHELRGARFTRQVEPNFTRYFQTIIIRDGNNHNLFFVAIPYHRCAIPTCS